jgi:hypothetical protein
MALPEDGTMPESALRGLADLSAAIAEAGDAGNTGDDLQVEIEGDPDDVVIVTESDDGAPNLRERMAKPAAEDDDDDDQQRQQQDPDAQDDDGQYSRSVQKRIQREAKLKREAREEATRERARADALEAELRKVKSKDESADLDAQLAAATEKYKQARLDVDFDAESEAQKEIAKLQAKRVRIEERESEGEPAARQAAPTEPQENPLVTSWRGRNAWFSDPKFELQHDAAIALNNRMLSKEGFSADDPEFYRALDRRIAETIRFPDGVLRSRQGSPVDSGMSAGPVSASGQSRPGKVVITPADQATMRTFGLDPTNKEHLKQFALEKAQR